MGISINLSIVIPLLPMAAALLILILLVNFNRTINRLTKPVSALIGSSLLSSCLISSLYYFKKIEGELVLSDSIQILKDTNLIVHLDLLNEKIIIFFSLLMATIIALCFYKLPRKKGYVSLMINLGLFSSLIMFSILLINFSGIT